MSSFIAGRLRVVAIGVGLFCLHQGWHDFTISQKTKSTPTTITAEELSRSGPPRDNAYVHVTNYYMNREFIVDAAKDDSPQEDSNQGGGNSQPQDNSNQSGGNSPQGNSNQGEPPQWSSIWMQILPATNTAYYPGKPIVLKDDAIHNQKDFNDFSKQTSFDGIVTDDLTTLSPPKTPFGMHFPVIDSDKVLVMELRARPDYASSTIWLVSGLGLILAGAFPLIRGFVLSVNSKRMVSPGSANKSHKS
jgi:hypothetical protein